MMSAGYGMGGYALAGSGEEGGFGLGGYLVKGLPKPSLKEIKALAKSNGIKVTYLEGDKRKNFTKKQLVEKIKKKVLKHHGSAIHPNLKKTAKVFEDDYVNSDDEEGAGLEAGAIHQYHGKVKAKLEKIMKDIEMKLMNEFMKRHK